MHAPAGRPAPAQATYRFTSERTLHLERRTTVGAPGHRNGDPAALPGDVNETEAQTVGNAVPFLVAQDGQEHQPVEPRRSLAHHDHQRDPVGCGQRPVTLVDLDRLKKTARHQPTGNGIQLRAVNEVAHRDAGELQHVLVWYGVVAVYPNLDNRLRRHRRLEGADNRVRRQRCTDYSGARPRRNAVRLKGHHPGSGTSTRPPVTASR